MVVIIREIGAPNEITQFQISTNIQVEERILKSLSVDSTSADNLIQGKKKKAMKKKIRA